MELKDTELEAIIKQALSDNTEVPEELNEKLMKRITAASRKRRLPNVGIRYAAAAAVVVAVGAGAMLNANYFSDRKNNEQSSIAVIDKNKAAEIINPENSDKPTDAYAQGSTNENAVQPKEGTSTAAESKETKTGKKPETSGKKTKNDLGTKNTSNPTTKRKNDVYIIADAGNTMSDSGQPQMTAEAGASSAAVGENKLFKYLNIAADDIGNALESLNILANNRIEEHYMAFSAAANGINDFAADYGANDAVLFSMAASPESDESNEEAVGGSEQNLRKSAYPEENVQSISDIPADTEALSKETDKALTTDGEPNITASYEVMADTDNYYSVRVDANADAGYIDEYSTYFTVDKNKESVVSLDDLYSGVPEYKEKLYNNICSQMKQQTEENKNVTYYIGKGGFESISGTEDFYMNDSEEVVIIYEKGTVAPYSQGNSAFNVGRPDELNTND